MNLYTSSKKSICATAVILLLALTFVLGSADVKYDGIESADEYARLENATELDPNELATSERLRQPTCEFCKKTLKKVKGEKHRMCSNCYLGDVKEKVHYCNKSCQKKDWNGGHRFKHDCANRCSLEELRRYLGVPSTSNLITLMDLGTQNEIQSVKPGQHALLALKSSHVFVNIGTDKKLDNPIVVQYPKIDGNVFNVKCAKSDGWTIGDLSGISKRDVLAVVGSQRSPKKRCELCNENIWSGKKAVRTNKKSTLMMCSGCYKKKKKEDILLFKKMSKETLEFIIWKS
eukprot:68639_1